MRTNTDLALRCDDTADDDFAGVDGVDQRRPGSSAKAYKPGGAGDDGGPSESGPAKPQLLPSSIGVSVMLPPGAELQLIARRGDDDAHTWQRSPRQEALALSHSAITDTRGLGDQAFAIANRAMAVAARQRFGVMQGKKAHDPSVRPPAWRPFQLAFVLMNLVGIALPNHPRFDPHREREGVDLLFFPTGGGKTEAYLGLAAFTLVMRRLRHGGTPTQFKA